MTETTVNNNRDLLGIMVNLIQISLSDPNSRHEQTKVCSTIRSRFRRKKAKRSSRFARETRGIRSKFTSDSIDCSAFASLRLSFASLLLLSHPSRFSSLHYQ